MNQKYLNSILLLTIAVSFFLSPLSAGESLKLENKNEILLQIKNLKKQIAILENKVLNSKEKFKESSEERDTISEELFDLDKQFSRSFKIGGYFDFKYLNFSKKNHQQKNGFDQNHTALFFQLNKKNFQFFSEMEWEHSGRVLKQERAWLKFNNLGNKQIELKVGHFFAPTHWNLNHYPTVSYTISEADLVRKILPWDFTGLKTKKTFFLKSTSSIDYTFYAGNGFDTSKSFPGQNNTDQLATGHRIGYEKELNYGYFKAYLHYYKDWRKNPFSNLDDMQVYPYTAFLFDSDFKKKRFSLWSAYGEGEFKSESKTSLKIKSHYLIPAYRFNEKWLLFGKFSKFEVTSISSEFDRKQNGWGLNFFPFAESVLKFEQLHIDYENSAIEDEIENRMSLSVYF